MLYRSVISSILEKEKVKGTLVFYKEGENDPVYSMNVELKEGDKLAILQNSEEEFNILSDEGEEEDPPQTENLSKIRFFYLPVGELKDMPAIEVELISFSQADISTIEKIIPSLIVEKGKFSSYLELNIAKHEFTAFAYSIYAYDTETNTRGELIENAMNVNNVFWLDTQQDDRNKTKYKFSTYQITNSIGYRPEFIMGTEW